MHASTPDAQLAESPSRALPPTGFGQSDKSVQLNNNGKDYALLLEPRFTLLDALRDDIDLPGAKKGCDRDIGDGVVRTARIALGGVAHKPWRSTAAGTLLYGQLYQQAIELLTDGALGYRHYHFKIQLAQRAVVRALYLAQGKP